MTLQKDGTYEIVTDRIKITLELPCKDALTQEFDSFLTSLYKAGEEDKVVQFKNLVIGKLIIKNKTDLYLKEGFSPAKAVLNLNDGTVVEGIKIEKIFTTVEYEAGSMGKNFKVLFTQRKNEYSRNFPGEIWTIKAVDDGAVGTQLIQKREEYAKLSTEILPAINVTKLTIKNEGEAYLKNTAEKSNYFVQIIKQNKEKIVLLPLAEAIPSMQKAVEEKMNGATRNQALYNNYVNLYNGFAEILKTALNEKKDIIKKGESSIDYYMVENVTAPDIASLEVTGGNFASVGSEIKQKMIKDFSMPVSPGSQSIMYIGFPNYDEQKISKIYFSMGSYQEEMK